MSLYQKHKRPITIGVALFALVTFSVTGVMLAVFRQWFAPKSPEKIKLADGRQISLEIEDYEVGRALSQLHRVLSSRHNFQALQRQDITKVEMPAFIFDGVPAGLTDNPSEVFAILRRVAIEQQIDVADEDVEAVIEFACREKRSMFPQPNQPKPPKLEPLQLARAVRAGSVASLRALVRDAIRISTLVRTELCAALDLTDAALADYVKEERKRITLTYLGWQAEDFEEELKRMPPTDPELQAWIAEQPDTGKEPFMHDQIVSFASVGILFDEADPADFTGEIGDLEISEADIEARYNEDKEKLYRKEPPKKDDGAKDGGKPGDKDGKPGGEAKGNEQKRGGQKKNEGEQKNESDGAGKDDENGGLLQRETEEQEGEKKATGEQKQPGTGGQKQPGTGRQKQPGTGEQKTEKPDSGAQDPAKTGTGEQGPRSPEQPAGAGEQKDPAIGPPTAEQATYVPLAEVRDEIIKKLQLEAALRKLLEKAQERWQASQPKPARPAEDQLPGSTGGNAPPGGGNPDRGDGREDENGGLLAQDSKQKDPAREKEHGGKATPPDTKAEQGPEKTDPAKDPGPQDDPQQPQQGGETQGPPAPEPFDLQKWFQEVSKDRKGLVYVPAGDKLLPPEEFQDLERFGEWGTYWTLRSVEGKALAGSIQRATKGAFFFQLADSKKDVMRPIEEVRDKVLEAYYLAESGTKAKERAEAFRKLVRAKAEALKPDEVKKLRDSIPEKVESELKEWETGIQNKITAKQKQLEGGSIPASAVTVLQGQIKVLQERLAKKDEEKAKIQERVAEDGDGQIAEAVESVLGEAFTQAAAEWKMEPKAVGPYFRDESNQGDPLFNIRAAGAEKFLKQTGYSKMQEAVKPDDARPGQPPADPESGWVSEPLEDATDRAFYVVRMDRIEEGSEDAVTRRSLERLRPQFNSKRVQHVLRYAYGLEAVKKRYEFASK